MNQSTIDQILRTMEERERLAQLERRRLAALSEDERRREREIESMAIEFLDLEAEESEGEDESDPIVEDGFNRAFDDLLPRDSKGIAYLFVKPHWRKLKQIRSDEFYDLTRLERREVIRRTRQWARIKGVKNKP